MYTFEVSIYEAFRLAKVAADKYATDKTTRKEFEVIGKIMADAKIDPREKLTAAQSSLIRRYYLKSLEA